MSAAAFFEFTKEPFAPPSQAGLVLATESVRSGLSRIDAALADGASPIAVVGSKGVGKTSVSRALRKALAGRFRVARIGDCHAPWERLRSLVATQLHPGDDGLSPRTLARARQGGDRLVLLIDQAEGLSAEHLDHLAPIVDAREAGGRPLLHTVAFFDVQMHTAASITRWLGERATLGIQLAPLSLEGTQRYLAQRLRHAGSRTAIFDAEAVAELHRLSDGIPGELNERCRAALEHAASEGVRSIDGAFVAKLPSPAMFGSEAQDLSAVGDTDLQEIRSEAPDLADLMSIDTARHIDTPLEIERPRPSPSAGELDDEISLDELAVAIFEPEPRPEPRAAARPARSEPMPSEPAARRRVRGLSAAGIVLLAALVTALVALPGHIAPRPFASAPEALPIPEAPRSLRTPDESAPPLPEAATIAATAVPTRHASASPLRRPRRAAPAVAA
ncbi:MAG: hypothetical protein MJE66_02990, partial [Proteobacteria bacterium]|nr:hypothetical protein [Pseudomonadota bacterium]